LLDKGIFQRASSEIDTIVNVDILFFGSSHAYRAFDPNVLKKYGLKSFVLQNKYNIAHLDKVVVEEGNKGSGTKVMNDLIDWADKNNITLALTPSTSFGATSVSRLKKFYKSKCYL
jgi:hypothetical protein